MLIFLFPGTKTSGSDKDPGDVILPVPHVADKGNTWAAACLTMILKYHEKKITLEDVVQKTGYPPVLNYGLVSEWAKKRHNIKLQFSERGTLKDLTGSIDRNYPVMVLQQYSKKEAVCSNRLVIGYNSSRKEFILKDPSNMGEPYRASYGQFQELWDQAGKTCPGWSPNVYWSSMPGGDLKGDVILHVPFEPNHGNTCASSSMTMMLKYLGTGVAFREVLEQAGLPPVIAYEKVNQWIMKKYRLKLVRLDNRNVEDIIALVKKGYPVMALQQFSLTNASGHNRVVTGFNHETGELIINDPSELGFGYRMSYKTFEELWDLLPNVATGWPPRPMWIILPIDKNPPL